MQVRREPGRIIVRLSWVRDVPLSAAHGHQDGEGRRCRRDGNEVAKAGRDRR